MRPVYIFYPMCKTPEKWDSICPSLIFTALLREWNQYPPPSSSCAGFKATLRKSRCRRDGASIPTARQQHRTWRWIHQLRAISSSWCKNIIVIVEVGRCAGPLIFSRTWELPRTVRLMDPCLIFVHPIPSHQQLFLLRRRWLYILQMLIFLGFMKKMSNVMRNLTIVIILGISLFL